MKYTKKQQLRMVKKYFTKVGREINWGGLTNEEVDEYVKSCRFTCITNYTWGGTRPSVDVLFLLADGARYYQAFIIKDGTLVELHQEHIAENCLACINSVKNDDDTITTEPF